MRYADPHACPDCRGLIAGQSVCPHCGFDLTVPEAAQLWRTFLEADRLVAQGRRRVPAESVTPTAPTEPRPTPMGVQAGISAGAGVSRSWSTGSILLGLGAACLVVAGIIFVTVAWGALGILGRALILLLVTAIVGGCARWATRRRLPGTAESLWAVFLALLTVDVFAAAAEGLFGVEGGDIAWVTTAWTIAIVAVSFAIVRTGRGPLGRDLVMPQLAAGLSPWIGAPVLAVRMSEALDDAPSFWPTAVGLLLASAVVAAAVHWRLRWALWTSVPLVGLFLIVMVTMAVGQAWDGEPALTFADAAPMLTLVVGALVVGRLAPVVTTSAVAAATAGVGYLVFVAAAGWAEEAQAHESVAVQVLAVLTAGVAVMATRRDPWSAGLRWACVGGAGVVATWLAVVAFTNLERIDTATSFFVSQGWWQRPTDAAFHEGWRMLVVATALAVILWAAGRWPSLRLDWASLGRPLASVVVAVGIVTSVSATELPFFVHATALVLVGVSLAFLLGSAVVWFGLVPAVFIILAPIVVPPDEPVTAFVLGLATVGFAACALVGADRPGPRGWLSAGYTGFAAAAAIATGGQWVDLADPGPGWLGTSIAGLSAAALLLAMALDEWPWHRIAVEVAAAAGLLVALGAEVDDGAAVALILTIGAVAAGLVSLLDEDRRWFRWVALALVGAAWVVRLAASDVTTVEAYTAPFALALLAAGVWRLRTDPSSRTWSVLTPGLTLALLPSLPQAIADPTGQRALLLGLVAAITLAAGVALRWGAPVVGGAAVIVVLLLVNIGPTAAAMPRWILIALAGLVLLVVGTTWEKRVAEGRAVVARILALR